MVFIQDIVRGTELTIASGGPPGGLPAATADPRQTPSPAARLAQARNKIGAPFWPAAHSASLLQPLLLPLCVRRRPERSRPQRHPETNPNRQALFRPL